MDVMMTVLRHRVPQSWSAGGRRQGENRSLHPPNVVPPCRPRNSCPPQGSPFYRLQGRAQTIGVGAQRIWAKKRRSVVPEDWAICLQVRWPNRNGSGLMVFSRTVRQLICCRENTYSSSSFRGVIRVDHYQHARMSTVSATKSAVYCPGRGSQKRRHKSGEPPFNHGPHHD